MRTFKPMVSTICALGFFLSAFALPFSEAEAKWIWTSETGWMNAKAVPKPSAEEQFAEAMRLYEKESYKRAYTAFTMMRRFYPGSEHLEEADFLAAECVFHGRHYMGAYKAFEKFLKNNPDSQHRAEVIQREIDIGKKFLSGARKEFLGVKLFRAREKGIEIIERAIGHDPFHRRVPEVLMFVADARFKKKQYDEAKKYYERIVKEHPNSDLRSDAEYRAILCDSDSAPDIGYDTTQYRNVEKMCRRLEVMDDGEVGKKAAKQAAAMRNNVAHKEFEVAEFYRKTRKNKAALVYYNSVVDNFSDTKWAEKAKEWIKRLSEN